MILTLILLAAIGVIVLAERSAEHLPFAIATLFLSAAAISFIVGDFDRAILLAGVLAAAITAASTIKHNYSALKLIVTDLPLMFAGTAPFFISQYPRAVLAVLTGTAALILAVNRDADPRNRAVSSSGCQSFFIQRYACLRCNGLQDKRRRHFLPADHGPAAVLLLDLHGFADRSTFLAASRRIGAERYCK